MCHGELAAGAVRDILKIGARLLTMSSKEGLEPNADHPGVRCAYSAILLPER